MSEAKVMGILSFTTVVQLYNGTTSYVRSYDGTFSCFTANLQIFTLFYFGVVYFTIEFERKKKKQGSNYGQIFPKIVHQKIITVFEMQYSFCQTLNAIQTNIKESKAFKRMN